MQGKTVVITGGGGALGAAVADVAAARGANVGLQEMLTRLQEVRNRPEAQ